MESSPWTVSKVRVRVVPVRLQRKQEWLIAGFVMVRTLAEANPPEKAYDLVEQNSQGIPRVLLLGELPASGCS